MGRPLKKKEDCYDQPVRINLKASTMNKLVAYQKAMKFPTLSIAARMFLEKVEMINISETISADNISVLLHR